MNNHVTKKREGKRICSLDHFNDKLEYTSSKKYIRNMGNFVSNNNNKEIERVGKKIGKFHILSEKMNNDKQKEERKSENNNK